MVSSSRMREICSAARCTGDDPMKYAPMRSRAASGVDSEEGST
jgi:hypothetical protein